MHWPGNHFGGGHHPVGSTCTAAATDRGVSSSSSWMTANGHWQRGVSAEPTEPTNRCRNRRRPLDPTTTRSACRDKSANTSTGSVNTTLVLSRAGAPSRRLSPATPTASSTIRCTRRCGNSCWPNTIRRARRGDSWVTAACTRVSGRVRRSASWAPQRTATRDADDPSTPTTIPAPAVFEAIMPGLTMVPDGQTRPQQPHLRTPFPGFDSDRTGN